MIPFPTQAELSTAPNPGLQSETAEAALIAVAVLYPEVIPQTDFVKPSQFFYLKYRNIWKALLALYNDNHPIDAVSIVEQLKVSGDIKFYKSEGDVHILISETLMLPFSPPSVGYYARMVETYAKRRTLAERSMAVAQQVAAGEMSTEEAISILTETAEEAGVSSNVKDDLYSMMDAVNLAFDRAQQPERNERQTAGLSEVDDLLGGGFRKNRIYVHGGRPGMGKTSAVLKYSLEAAKEMKAKGNNEMVVVITLEMDAAEMANRLLASVSKIPYDVLDRGDELTDEQYNRLFNAIAELDKLKEHYYFWNPSSVNPEQIWTKLRSIQNEMRVNVGAVFVDHIHIMSVPQDRRNLDRDERRKYSYIIDTFRMMRDKLKPNTQEHIVDATWHLVAQLNRDVEKRHDKRPLMSDLREAGKIEENANTVIMYYRDSVYVEEMGEDHTMEVIVRKNRGGKMGTARVAFFGETYAIENLYIEPKGKIDLAAPPKPKEKESGVLLN